MSNALGSAATAPVSPASTSTPAHAVLAAAPHVESSSTASASSAPAPAQPTASPSHPRSVAPDAAAAGKDGVQAVVEAATRSVTANPSPALAPAAALDAPEQTVTPAASDQIVAPRLELATPVRRRAPRPELTDQTSIEDPAHIGPGCGSDHGRSHGLAVTGWPGTIVGLAACAEREGGASPGGREWRRANYAPAGDVTGCLGANGGERLGRSVMVNAGTSRVMLCPRLTHVRLLPLRRQLPSRAPAARLRCAS